MDECAVINASPLIFLARGGHLGLLTRLIQQVVVPQPVAAEIQRRGPQDVTVQALQCVPALTVVPAPEVPVTIERWGLGLGESSVLALASVTSQAVVIMDDLAGRKCAHALGLPVRGTLGLILLAKRRGLIPLARPVLEDLVRGGLYLSRPILDEALQRVGE